MSYLSRRSLENASCLVVVGALAAWMDGHQLACADGLTPSLLQGILAAGSVSPNIGLTADQQQILRGALQANGGDASSVLVNAGGGLPPLQLRTIAQNLNGLQNTTLPIDGSKAMVGPITTPGVVMPSGGIYFWNGPYGQHRLDGGSSSANNSAVYLQPYLYGPSTNGNLFHIWAGDGIQDSDPNGFSMISALDNVGSGASGNRNVVVGSVVVGQTPVTSGAYEAVFAQGQAMAPMPSPAGNGWPMAIGTYSGGLLETGWDYTRVNASAPGLFLSYGREINVAYQPGTTVGENIGLAIVDASDGPNSSNQSGYPGDFANIGISVAGAAFDCAFCVGKPTGGWSQTATSTLFGAYKQQYGGTSNPVARYGVDLRAVSFGSAAFASDGFAVDGSGTLSARTLVTSGSLQAVSGSMSGAIIDQPGAYTYWPTFVVGDSQTVGSGASVRATDVAANEIVALGSTGSGYSVGDVLTATVPSGTPPAWMVDAVDANGGVTAWHNTTVGNATGFSGAASVFSLAGGTGTGATAYINWSWSANTEAFQASFALFDGSGSGYKVGDKITIVGDVGQAASFTVQKTNSIGGILMPLALSSGGDQTSIASNTFHVATGGSGSGASLQVAYGVKAVATNPGSGYLSNPLPLITSSQSSFGNAVLRPVIQATPAPLVLNAGGKVYLDSAGGMWVTEINGKTVIGSGTASLFSIDQQGNVVAKGTITQNGNP